MWLIVAGASMFAAFPAWYATMFSALYLAVVLLLVALFARGVSFEYRGKRDSQRWRTGWSWALTIGSIVIPLLIGVALGDLLHGLPIDSEHDFTGNFFSLLTGYGLMTGVTLLVLSLLHGATFLALRTTGEIRDRAHAAARSIGVVAILVNLAWVVWTLVVIGGGTVPEPTQIFGVLAVIFAQRLATTENDGWAFVASGFGIAAVVGQIFIALYPNVMVSSTNHAYNLTVSNAAAGHYGLVVMTVVAVLFFPIVLLYQGWSFHVFRRRVTAPPDLHPARRVVDTRCALSTRACSAGRESARPLLILDSALGIGTAAGGAARSDDARADRRAGVPRHAAARALA